MIALSCNVEYAEVNLDEQMTNVPRSSPSNRPPATIPPDAHLQKTNDGTGDMQGEKYHNS